MKKKIALVIMGGGTAVIIAGMVALQSYAHPFSHGNFWGVSGSGGPWSTHPTQVSTTGKWNPNNGYGYGMMGEYGSSGYGVTGGYSSARASGGYGYGMMGTFSQAADMQTLTNAQAQQVMQESLQNAVINPTANTVTYSGNHVHIVLLGGPKMADEKFVIGGLVNPIIHVSQGANVTMELINEDDGMPHNVVVTPVAPPYPYVAMMIGSAFPGAGVPVIPEAQNGQYAAVSTTFKATSSGQFYYLCQVPGHAEKGMYGAFVVD